MHVASGSFSVGSVYGIHPNLKNTYLQGFYFVEGMTSFSVKGIPFRFSARGSDEPYRSGRAAYVRLHFDAASYRRSELSGLKQEMEENDRALRVCLDSIHLLEKKWSYWNIKKSEWKSQQLQIPGIPLTGVQPMSPDSISFPETPGIPATPNLPGSPNLSNPTLSLDSINAQLSGYELQLSEKKQQLADLQTNAAKLQSAYDKLQKPGNKDFFSGIRKADLGMSTISQGSLSANVVPIQGIHVAGTVRRMFYDVASGFTLPNQLFSNLAFDQLITNSSNLFNAGDFFAVNSVRFVSSAVVGYGEQGRNAVSVESFYTGRSWEAIRSNQQGLPQATTNIGFFATPKKMPLLTLNGTVGHSFTRDSAAISTDNLASLAWSSGINWKLPKLKSHVKGNYRRLGSQYDGWSQGIYLRGAEHADLSWRQSLSKKLSVQLRGAQDRYHAADSSGAIRKTRQGGTEIQWKPFKNAALVANYTLLELQSDTLAPADRLSHLGRAGLYFTRTLGEWKNTSSLDGGYALLSEPDSSQRLTQLSAHMAMTWKKWTFGLRAAYSEFSGLSRLGGKTYLLQPEIAHTGEALRVSFQYQYQQSEQFGADGGFVFSMDYRFSRLFSISYLAQRWLPTDYTFFMTEEPDIVQPLYMRWKLTLHLNE